MSVEINFEGKVALVTGSSGGLGAGFARALAKAGAQVILASRREELLKELRAEIEADGGAAHIVNLDVTDSASIKAAVEHAEAEVGPIDILVNNAGVTNKRCDLLKITPDDYSYVMDTNVRGVFFVAQEVARRMILRSKNDPGRHHRIINIASTAGLVAFPNIGIYGASKAAVIHMTKAMAVEWGKYGINVNAICPGLIKTDMTTTFFNSDEGLKVIEETPRKRVGDPACLDSILLLLAGDGAHFINGAVIKVDDGLLT